jgi:SAM-dependent methyltransferase
MHKEKRDFDAAAATWDENPRRVKLAADVAAAIKSRVALTPAMNIADFGCGTGLLSFMLQPHVGSLTGIDSSPGMLEVFMEKSRKLRLENVRSQLVDLDKGDRLNGRYELVVSNMTLHHVRETAPLLELLHEALVPGGTLCLTDLDLDGGHFHDDSTGVFHNGFDRAELRRAFQAAGFSDIRDSTAAEVAKPGKNGEKNIFTIFLMTGHK